MVLTRLSCRSRESIRSSRAAQGALEGVPGEGVDQHLFGVQQQIAAVGAVQGAGLDEGEVGERVPMRAMCSTRPMRFW
jgi:hypothetical protein